MKHRPNRIVVLVTELTLKFGCREALLCAGEEMHGNEPISQRQLASMHDGVGLEALPIMTILALKAQLVLLPIVAFAAAFRAYNALFLSIFFQLYHACFLVGKQIVKLNNIHILSLFLFCKDRNPVYHIAVHHMF
jgi:hypothetical protein